MRSSLPTPVLLLSRALLSSALLPQFDAMLYTLPPPLWCNAVSSTQKLCSCDSQAFGATIFLPPDVALISLYLALPYALLSTFVSVFLCMRTCCSVLFSSMLSVALSCSNRDRPRHAQHRDQSRGRPHYRYSAVRVPYARTPCACAAAAPRFVAGSPGWGAGPGKCAT